MKQENPITGEMDCVSPGSMINPCDTCIARSAESHGCHDCSRCLAFNYYIIDSREKLIADNLDYYENDPNSPAWGSDDIYHACKRIVLILNDGKMPD
jgi:hypothetical protein